MPPVSSRDDGTFGGLRWVRGRGSRVEFVSWWRTTGCVLAAIVGASLTTVVTAAPAGASQQQRVRCVHTMPDPTEAACYRDKYHRGGLGHSSGHIVPARIRRLLVREYQQHHRYASARTAVHAIGRLLANVDCVGAANRLNYCAGSRPPRGEAIITVPWRKVTGVAIKCGTGAFIAVHRAPALGVPPTPVAVAGEAIGGCLFFALVDEVF